VDEANIPKVEPFILAELARLERDGLPPEEVEAALLGMEFSHREIRRSGGPWSLVWARRALRGWLHGRKPWETLLFVPPFEAVKKRLAGDGRFFEGLIRKYLLDNPHRAFTALVPEPGFLEKKEREREEALAARLRGLSARDKAAVRRKSAELRRVQERGDSPEALAAIPHLRREDLTAEIPRVPRELGGAGFPALLHPLDTNGICYADFAFPVDILPEEDSLWLPFFASAAVSVGLPGRDYGEVSSRLARVSGGFHAFAETGSAAPGASAAAVFPQGVFDIRGRDWLIFRLKALDGKFAEAVELARSLILEADFSDERRVRDLVLEAKNEAASSLAPAGHSFAMTRSGRAFSRAKAAMERWSGLEQLLFIHRLAGMDTGAVCGKLTALRDAVARAGLLVNLTAGPETAEAALAETERAFAGFAPPRPRPLPEGGLLPPLAASGLPETAPGPEVFASPSLQVGFAALTFPAAAWGSGEQAGELAAAHQLSTGALWEHLRMKGGAYGAFAAPDHIERAFALGTYRDPSPLRSLAAFASILKSAAAPVSEDELVKAVIGAYGKETRPRTPADHGFADFCRFLCGVEDGQRAARLRALAGLSGAGLRAAFDGLAEEARRAEKAADGHPRFAHAVIIAAPDTARKAATALSTEPRPLPC
jgi:Zn-dependent M16 (insulinase) family peptidase